MIGALRLQAITVPVPDLEEAERFYRWTFRLESRDQSATSHVRVLGWGAGEDRVRLVHASATSRADEAISLRMTALSLEDALHWCRDHDFELVEVTTTPHDRERAAASAPGVPLAVFEAREAHNLSRFTVRAWAGLHVELIFPLPREILAQRGLEQRFSWRSEDWSGLETPGLLGVTLSGTDVAAGRRFFRNLGIEAIDPADSEAASGGPLRIGDQQIVLEKRETAGIQALALVVSQARLDEVKRTLKHLGGEFREAGNRVLARDPAGRVVFVQGVHAA
jgi:catechol 2,3-dioxygenase-like lactoylglutathione lyase family enzyme